MEIAWNNQGDYFNLNNLDFPIDFLDYNYFNLEEETIQLGIQLNLLGFYF